MNAAAAGTRARRAPSWANTLWCLLLVSSAPRVAAQPRPGTELVAARELASQGMVDVEHGDFATSEDLFSRAIAIHDAPTLRLARARFRSGLGRLIASAEDYHY